MKTRLRPVLLVSLIGAFGVIPARAQNSNNQNCGYWSVPPTKSQDDKMLNPDGSIGLETVKYSLHAIDGNSGAVYCITTAGPVSATGSSGRKSLCLINCTVICNPEFTYSFTEPDTFTGTILTFTNIGTSKAFDSASQSCTASGFTYSLPSRRCHGHTCPVILDLSGQGFFFTDTAHGVKFDFEGNGNPIQMAWTAPGADNGFLALPGLDGLVHNSTQLFGNFTPQAPSDHRNGFAALAVYDDPANGGNGDGVIDSKDAVFKSLRIWIDANHDGISQPEELHTLQSLGVNSISLDYKQSDKVDQFGNALKYWAPIELDHPHESKAVDVFFVSQ